MKKKNRPKEYSAVISKGTELIGILKCEGDLFVQGSVEGEIASKGCAFVEADSVINADVVCQNMVVSGEINGNIIVASSLEVASTGRVFGNINCDELIIDEGAIYRGEININKQKESVS